MRRERVTRLVVLALAVVGILLSLYLLKAHYEPPRERFCDINDTFNCDGVNYSPYAEILGVPVSLLGALHYLLVIAFSVAAPWVAKRFEFRLLYLLLVLELAFGLLFSAYLTGVEMFLLHVYCPLCLLSAAITVVHFLLALWLWRSTPFSE